MIKKNEIIRKFATKNKGKFARESIEETEESDDVLWGGAEAVWCRWANLEALAVHNSGAGFVVFLLGDPHLLEGGE